MYLNRLIREDRDKQIENLSRGKEYSHVEDEIANVEMVAVSKQDQAPIYSSLHT